MSKRLRNIILVDDDDITNYLHKELFEDLNIAEKIIVFSDGATAFNLINKEFDNQEYNISKQRPDIIFLDLNMPAMDGFEFLDEISKWAALSPTHTRIFLCSSSVHYKDKERAGHYPVAGFITKPLTPEILKNLLTPEKEA